MKSKITGGLSVLLAVLCALSVCLLGGCRGDRNDPAGRTYVYEKDGCGGEFTVNVEKDGTFWYYEGPLSSHFGNGTWSFNDGVLTLTETDVPAEIAEDAGSAEDRINRFAFEDGALIYIAEESHGFIYIDVLDGDRFIGK